MNEQQQNLQRVAQNIEAFVIEFLRDYVAKQAQPTFFLSQLTHYIERRAAVAPDSASRILRMLRQQKKIDYRVINRAKSLYELTTPPQAGV